MTRNNGVKLLPDEKRDGGKNWAHSIFQAYCRSPSLNLDAQAKYFTQKMEMRLCEVSIKFEPGPFNSVYLSLGKNSKSRQMAYRSLFQAELNIDAISDIRQALTQNQPLGNSHFYAKLETMTGVRCEPKPRGRPKKQKDNMPEKNREQGELPL
jgi:putative transposase